MRARPAVLDLGGERARRVVERSAMKTAPYPSAARSTEAIAGPIPAVIHIAPKPNPTALPKYRNELSTAYLLVVKPCPTTIRGGAADTCTAFWHSARGGGTPFPRSRAVGGAPGAGRRRGSVVAPAHRVRGPRHLGRHLRDDHVGQSAA